MKENKVLQSIWVRRTDSMLDSIGVLLEHKYEELQGRTVFGHAQDLLKKSYGAFRIVLRL